MNIILIICSIATGHALFWAAVLFNLNHKLSNRLLALLLIVLALRVGKSVTGIVLPGHMHFFTTVGVVSMAAIGPLLFLFSKSLFDKSFKFKPTDYLHFAPGVALLVITFATQWTYLNLSYYIFTTHVFIYLIWSTLYVLNPKNNFSSDDLKWKWIISIISGIGLIWITFVLQLLFYHPVVYKLIVITAAIVFYVLSWWAIQRSKLFLPDTKKKTSDDNGYDELGKRILILLEREEIFIDPNLTVTKLATTLRMPPYLISRVINHCFEKSFSEVLLQYRIKKSEELLLTDGNKSLTIEAIAYESGFNTLSAFYTAFKKINKKTPAQFRDTPHQSTMKIATR
jgi:AraC-like DNA-binding protein